MRLFFCDICNESIPLQDIKEGKSATIKGKIFCRKCNPLNELVGSDGGTAPAAPAAGGSSTGLLAMVAILLVVVVCGLGFIIYDMKIAAKQPAADAGNGRMALLESRLAEIEATARSMRTDLDGASDLSGLQDRLSRLEQEVGGFATAQTRLSADIAELQEGIVAVAALRDRVEGVLLRQEESLQELERVGKAVTALNNELAALAERGPVAMAGGGDPGGGTPGAGAGEVELDAELLAIVEKLSDEEAMTRWEAVDQILRRRDKALIPYVIPLLDDRDTFVRTQAIYTLGELKAMPAVPRLIKLLRDDEIIIREGALNSLIVITGQNLKFDVDGNRSVRDKGIRRWEEWLEKNKDKF